MSCPSWSNDEVLEFLDLYKNEGLLWDPKHTKHKDKREKVMAWKRIQSKINMSCSVEDLKRKKESLMATYRGLKKKTLKSSEYPASWYAFSLMDSFLNEIYSMQYNSSQNLDNEFQEDTQNESTYFEPIDVIYHNTTSKTIKKNKRSVSRSPCIKNRIFKSVASKSSNSSHCSVNKVEDSDRLTNVSVEDKDSLSPDECELYAQLLVKKLRKLDEHQRDIVMHEIDNIIFRAIMKSHKTEIRSTSSTPTGKTSSPIFIVSQENALQYEDESIMYNEQQMDGSP